MIEIKLTLNGRPVTDFVDPDCLVKVGQIGAG